jgi:uncharacterized protein (DUF302 family)
MFENAYTFGVRLSTPFAMTRERVEAALRAEGFGVLTEIDVAKTLKTKLDVDRPPYLILGACNPPLAHRALTAEPSIGALLPCNVVIRQDGETTIVEAMDPRSALGLVDEPAVAEVAAEARERLWRAVEALGSGVSAADEASQADRAREPAEPGGGR